MAKIYVRKDESLEDALKRFKRQVKKEGIMEDVRKKEYYKSKGQLEREKKQQYAKNAYIREKLSKLYDKEYFS